jgi:hypothetical protein
MRTWKSSPSPMKPARRGVQSVLPPPWGVQRPLASRARCHPALPLAPTHALPCPLARSTWNTQSPCTRQSLGLGGVAVQKCHTTTSARPAQRCLHVEHTHHALACGGGVVVAGCAKCHTRLRLPSSCEEGFRGGPHPSLLLVGGGRGLWFAGVGAAPLPPCHRHRGPASPCPLARKKAPRP